MDFMIDLETWSTRPNAAIASIGVTSVRVPGEDDWGSRLNYYQNVTRESCLELGMHVDSTTEAWWDQQPNRAELEKNKWPLRDALVDLSAWLEAYEPNLKYRRVWSNGAGFDIPILENAYALMGITCPWNFWNARCYRTMKSLHRDVPCRAGVVAHNALADAQAQASHLQRILIKHYPGYPNVDRSLWGRIKRAFTG